MLNKQIIDDIEILYNCFKLESCTTHPDYCMTKVDICKGAKDKLLTDSDRLLLGSTSYKWLNEQREKALQLPAIQSLLKVPQIKDLHDEGEPQAPNMRALCTCFHIMGYHDDDKYLKEEVQTWAHNPLVYGIRTLGLEELSKNMETLDTPEFQHSLQEHYRLNEHSAKTLATNLKFAIPSIMDGKISLQVWLRQLGEPKAQAAKDLLYHQFLKVRSDFVAQMTSLDPLMEVAGRMERLLGKMARPPS